MVDLPGPGDFSGNPDDINAPAYDGRFDRDESRHPEIVFYEHGTINRIETGYSSLYKTMTPDSFLDRHVDILIRFFEKTGELESMEKIDRYENMLVAEFVKKFPKWGW